MHFQALILLCAVCVCAAVLRRDCQPLYVRWSGVKVGASPRLSGAYRLDECRQHCSDEQHTTIRDASLPCAGFNFKRGANDMAHLCEYFDDEQIRNVDWYVEADGRFAFFRKYCVKSRNVCKLPAQFEFYIDRYLDPSQINRDLTVPLEQCFGRCLDEQAFRCRSFTYNRTSGLCRLSIQTKESQPEMLKINSDPNFRVDYYENMCEGGIEMKHRCLDDGIVVSAEAKIPYTGAMYGLYDFVNCKIEPKRQMAFSIFLPYDAEAKNCSDSVRTQGDNYIAEVVVSSGGVKPLYYITERDIVYHARCPKTPVTPVAATASVKMATVQAAVEILPAATTSRVVSRQTATSQLSTSPVAEQRTAITETPPLSVTRVKSKEALLVEETRKPTTTPSLRLAKLTSLTEGQKAVSHVLSVTTPRSLKKEQMELIEKATLDETSRSGVGLSRGLSETVTQRVTVGRSPSTHSRAATRSSTTPTSTSTTQSTTAVPETTVSTSSTTRSSVTTSTRQTTPATTTSAAVRSLKFDILNNGQPITAVVIGNKVTLDFQIVPRSAGDDLQVMNCQIEPVDSPYSWERDPLQIIHNGCPADGVGLVCAPTAVESGAHVTMEAFRYTSTSKVRYLCELQVCENAPCIRTECPTVDGCGTASRHFPTLAEPSASSSRSTARIYHVTKELLVVNSESELRYFLSTGNVPSGLHPPGGFFKR